MKIRSSIKRIITIAVTVLMLFGMGICYASAASFETEAYHVDIRVNEDNSWEVEETITMNFHGGHGIYRYIPYVGQIYYWQDGEEITKPYKLKITDIRIPDYPYEKSYENDSIVFKIGDGDVTLQGSKTFHIGYHAKAHEDRVAEFDQFYWDIIPQDWNTPIPEASFTITLPKDFDEKQLNFYFGAYGYGDTEQVAWSREGNTITGKIKSGLGAREGVTCRLMLPEGYFVGERDTGWMLSVAAGIMAGVALLAALLWFLFGRDPKVVRTVEFYPPPEINSAEVGYIIDGVADDKDLVSLIIYFANQGYLTIEDQDGDFILTKKTPLPAGSKSYEKVMFNGLFRTGERVSLNSLKEEFYEDFAAARTALRSYFTGSSKRLFTQTSVLSRGIASILMLIPSVILAYFVTEYSYYVWYWMLPPLFAAAVTLLGSLGMIWNHDKRESRNKKKRVASSVLYIIIIAVGNLGILGWGLAMGAFWVAVAAVGASILILIFTILMKQRTRESAALLGKILGFKEFIRTAELDRIQKLVDQDPSYFYNVLPYAYVFGLTDKWVKKFETIAVSQPDWYVGGFGGRPFTTYLFLSSFHECTRALQSNLTVPPHSGSGGFGSGGGFGGGFTGGGFSGGGMGGGGGGGW